MAQHNIVHLFGTVCTQPTVKRSEDGTLQGAVVTIAAYASGMRSFEGSRSYTNDDVCQVQIRTGDEKRGEQIASLRMYDIISLKGTLNTRNVRRFILCDECGTKFQIEKRREEEEETEAEKEAEKHQEGSMITFVTPIMIDIRERKFGDEAETYYAQLRSGFFDELGNEDKEKTKECENAIKRIENEACKFVMERRELSNEVQLIGNLCADPKEYRDGDAQAASYQLGINRKFYLTDDAPGTRSDYPFIRSYGVQAENDLAALKETSLVLVDGFLKRRSFRRESVCPECGKSKFWKGSVIEAVPYSVEYLSDYKTAKERKEEAEGSGAGNKTEAGEEGGT